MGAQGTNWIGVAPFTTTTHIFQNLGDGTYSHSGSLAIRAAVVAGVNITYKILYNDAVAMTGGQPVEGGLSVNRIVQQVRAEERFPCGGSVGRSRNASWRAWLIVCQRIRKLYPRVELGRIQQELCGRSGVSVIIFDQVCAAEKRRRRKIKAFPDPDRRVLYPTPKFARAAATALCAVELSRHPTTRDRARTKAQNRSIRLQQGHLVPEGLLSLLCNSGGRETASCGSRRER